MSHSYNEFTIRIEQDDIRPNGFDFQYEQDVELINKGED